MPFLQRANAVLGIDMDVQCSTPKNAKHAPLPSIHASHIYKLLRSILGESMVICLLRMWVRAFVPARSRSPITTRNQPTNQPPNPQSLRDLRTTKVITAIPPPIMPLRQALDTEGINIAIRLHEDSLIGMNIRAGILLVEQ